MLSIKDIEACASLGFLSHSDRTRTSELRPVDLSPAVRQSACTNTHRGASYINVVSPFCQTLLHNCVLLKMNIDTDMGVFVTTLSPRLQLLWQFPYCSEVGRPAHLTHHRHWHAHLPSPRRPSIGMDTPRIH